MFGSTIKLKPVHAEAFGYLAIGGPLVPEILGTRSVRRKRSGSLYEHAFISVVLQHMVVLAIGMHERYRHQGLSCTNHSKSSLAHSQWSTIVVGSYKMRA